jgi:hypothetical protein
MREQTEELIETMVEAAWMIDEHFGVIMVCWSQGCTTAFLNTLNDPFSAVNRWADGYRMLKYTMIMLSFDAGKPTKVCYLYN